MNIAMLCHPSAGGSGVVATELALALAGQGHHVHMIATQVPFRLNAIRLPDLELPSLDKEASSLEGEVMFHEIQNASYPLFDQPLTSLAAVNTLVSVIEEHNIDLVHAHYAIPHATSALLARDIVKGKVRVVTTLHGTDVTLVGLEPSFLRTTRYAIEASDAVTAVSHYLAEQTNSVMGANKKIDVVYNWVDTERFVPITDPTYRRRFARDDESLIVHASNFREIKRPKDVIRTFSNILKSRKARLIMIGDGPERLPTLELAKEMGLAKRVHFIGSFPNVEMIFGVADLLLLPSAKESFGLVALEAMACGVAVISTNIGGLPEVIEHSVTGFTLPIGDIAGMSEAAITALEQLPTMRMAARERAIREFHQDVILPRYIEVYQRSLA
ncbi:MAG: N-acetyl-alpha-D-glucosaminyl L-malate synthase BshA [Deinococcales bacterium]